MKQFPKVPELSPEEKRMFQRQDFVGLSYYHCEQIRGAQSKTEVQEKRLLKHDQEEAKIREDSRATLRAAHEAIDHGTNLLLRLVRSESLRYETISTDGEDFSHDDAFECFVSRIDYSFRQLIRLAEDRTPKAARHLWFQTKSLVEAFGRLALVQPEDFRSVAEDSLTMPSLRARNPKFDADSAAIASAIHLGDKHPVGNITDNRTRAGAACSLVMLSIFDQILSERQTHKWELDTFQMMQKFAEAPEIYRSMTFEDYVSRWRHPDLVEILLRCAALPPWPQNTPEWWANGVLPLVRREFELLAADPKRNPALWAELEKGGERDSLNDMRRYMEKLCHNKFVQIVKACPQMPLP